VKFVFIAGGEHGGGYTHCNKNKFHFDSPDGEE
jgi:hypothetical protein